MRLLFCSAAGLIAAEGKATRADEIRMNANVAEYHVPVNADVHDIEVIFVDEPDDTVNSLGIKGLGEIGIVGFASGNRLGPRTKHLLRACHCCDYQYILDTHQLKRWYFSS